MWVSQQATYCVLNLLMFMVLTTKLVFFNCIHQFVPLCHSCLNSTPGKSEWSMACFFFRHQSHVFYQSFYSICFPALEPQHSHSTGLPILSQVPNCNVHGGNSLCKLVYLITTHLFVPFCRCHHQPYLFAQRVAWGHRPKLATAKVNGWILQVPVALNPDGWTLELIP